MRAAKGFVLAAGTASIVALGLFLPDMVSAVQDRSNDDAVSLFETSQVSSIPGIRAMSRMRSACSRKAARCSM